MVRIVLLVWLPVMVFSSDLYTLIDYASKHNLPLQSKKTGVDSKMLELEATRRDRFPQINIGANYQNLNDRTVGLPGVVVSGYISVGFDLYDGGKNSELKKQKRYEMVSTRFEKDAFKRSLALSIVEDFFKIKNLNASINALYEERKALKAQLDRIKRFVDADMATQDDVYKLQAAYDTNQYNIASLKFDRLSLYRSLELKVGKPVKQIKNSSFKKQSGVKFRLSESVKALQAKQKAMLHQAKVIGSEYNPTIKVENSYNRYDYAQVDTTHPAGIEDQNKLLVSLNMKLFDNGAKEKSKLAVLKAKDALEYDITYQIKSDKMLYNLAKSRIRTMQANIKSTKSALNAALSVLKTIEQKYKAGLVDNITYLDALSQKTNAQSIYHTARNSLEVAYSILYYYAGQDIKRFIR